MFLSASVPSAYADLGTVVGVSACATATTVSYCVYRACQASLTKKATFDAYEGLLAAVKTINGHSELSKIYLDSKQRGTGRPKSQESLKSPQHVISSLRAKPHLFVIDPDAWPVVIQPKALDGGWYGWNLNLGLYAYLQDRVILAVTKEILGDVTLNYFSREDLESQLKDWQAEFLAKTGQEHLSFTVKDSLQIQRLDLLKNLQRFQVAIEIDGVASQEVRDKAYVFVLSKMAEMIKAGHRQSNPAYEFGFSQKP